MFNLKIKQEVNVSITNKAADIASSARASDLAMYGGSGAAVVSGLSYRDRGVVIGIVIGVLGFLYNIYYKERVFSELKKKSTISLKDD